MLDLPGVGLFFPSVFLKGMSFRRVAGADFWRWHDLMAPKVLTATERVMASEQWSGRFVRDAAHENL